MSTHELIVAAYDDATLIELDLSDSEATFLWSIVAAVNAGSEGRPFAPTVSLELKT